MRRLPLPLLLLVFLLPITLQGQSTMEPPPDLMPLLLAEKVDAITDGVARGSWNGSTEGQLARALVDDSGLSAVEEMRRLASSSSTPADLQTVALFHLYGYWRLVDNRSEVNQALEQLNGNPQLASTLFRGSIPGPMALTTTAPANTGGSYAVQIGAFGSQGNAQRLADEQVKRGFTVAVVPIKSGGKTLYAVWVGRFDSSREASSFGTKYYGKEGKGFRVVNQ